jgi:putative DNA primase/helicase
MLIDEEEKNKIVMQIINEDNLRERLYPSESKVPHEKRAVHFLGRILDKKELASQFLYHCPMYYDQADIFWSWDFEECRWKQIDDLDVLNMIDLASECNVINGKERSEIINAIKLMARRQRPQEVEGKMLLQFKKEMLNLETGDRFEATPKYFVKNPLPHRLGKSADVTKFNKLFGEWVSAEDVPKLYEMLAYAMLPSYPLERTFYLYGAGSNGKSVFRSIMRKFLGDYNVCSSSLTLLTGNSRFESAKLYGKLMCEMGETNISKLENTEIIKKIVSGKDFIGAEWKHKGQIDFVNYAKLVISTNNLPPTDDKTDGFYRKTLIIDFPNTFSEQRDIMAELTEEDYEGLAMYCVDVLYQLLKRRAFSNEGDFQARRERYEHRSNPLDKFWNLFVDDGDPNADITSFEFEKRINEWCRENRMRILSDRTIAAFLKTKGIQQVRIWKDWYENDKAVRRQVRSWAGIKWK